MDSVLFGSCAPLHRTYARSLPALGPPPPEGRACYSSLLSSRALSLSSLRPPAGVRAIARPPRSVILRHIGGLLHVWAQPVALLDILSPTPSSSSASARPLPQTPPSSICLCAEGYGEGIPALSSSTPRPRVLVVASSVVLCPCLSSFPSPPSAIRAHRLSSSLRQQALEIFVTAADLQSPVY